MLDSTRYQLLDFGHQRKLERFGPVVLNRRAPAAGERPALPTSDWQSADAVFEREEGQQGTWRTTRPLPEAWPVQIGELSFEVRLTPFGHVGLFPEQAGNWSWLERCVRQAERPVKLLNLFAYTGGSSLAAARGGAEVVHVDAASNVVAWARDNAAASGLKSAPIRWIVEDVRKFARREVRRQNQYDAIVLDPPSYGHGPKGQVWKIDRDLPPLLETCRQLLVPDPLLLLITCHSPGHDVQRLRHLLKKTFGWTRGVASVPMPLTSQDGRRLPSGTAARWRNTSA